MCVCMCKVDWITEGLIGKWELAVGVPPWKADQSSEQWWKDFTADLFNYEDFYTWSELRIKKKYTYKIYIDK